MNELDVFNLLGFGWLYDRVEERYGRGAALLVTFAGAFVIIGGLILILVLVVSR
jgi:hypothetical protein